MHWLKNRAPIINHLLTYSVNSSCRRHNITPISQVSAYLISQLQYCDPCHSFGGHSALYDAFPFAAILFLLGFCRRRFGFNFYQWQLSIRSNERSVIICIIISLTFLSLGEDFIKARRIASNLTAEERFTVNKVTLSSLRYQI